MQDAVFFILRTLIELYVLTFALRLILQWSRADAWNPLSQFILRVTDPVVLRLRRVIPAIRRIDTATVLALLVLQALATTILVYFSCVGAPEPGQVLALTLLRIIRLLLRIYFFAILIYVILSWVSPGGYNPASALLGAVAEPVLRPFRRWIPAIGGLDLSPIFAIIAIQALTMLLPVDAVLSSLLCVRGGEFLL